MFHASASHLVIEDFTKIDDNLLRWLEKIIRFNSLIVLRYSQSAPIAKDLEYTISLFRENLVTRPFRPFLLLKKFPARFPESADFELK